MLKNELNKPYITKSFALALKKKIKSMANCEWDETPL